MRRPSGGGRGGSLVRARRTAPRPRSPLFSLKWRLVSLMTVFVMVFGFVVLKQVDLQLLHPSRYNQWGMRQRLVSVALPAGRGSIIDRNGEDLALSIPQTTVYADPSKVDRRHAAQALAPVLHVPADQLLKQLSAPGSFVYVARQVDDATAKAVDDLKLGGVHTVTEARRFDPSGRLGLSLVGSTDTDGRGISGLEEQYDETLTGRAGKLSLERAGGDSGGTIATGRQQLTPPRPGHDVMLTLDRSLQYETERVLGEQVKATSAKGGIVVVSRPSTGEILALANMTRNPDTGEVTPSSNNAAATTMFEPGSVTKVITVSAAVEQGAVTPQTSLEVPGELQVADTRFQDDEPHGVQAMTVSDILAQSSNIGTIMLAKQLGKDRLNQYLLRFGMGRPTALAFPNEAAGILKSPGAWSGTDIGSVPIGQGISVTAVQMLSAFNTIANDGRYVAPKLVAATIDPDGTRHPTTPSAQHRVVSPSTARSVQDMMVQVVKAGTGAKAAVPGYTVAGKTGTARKPLPEGGYRDVFGNYHYVSTFAGFVSGSNADLSVIVVMDEPIGAFYAADVAAPVFSRLASYALRQLHIPPLASAVTSTGDAQIVVDNQAPPAPPATDPNAVPAGATSPPVTDPNAVPAGVTSPPATGQATTGAGVPTTSGAGTGSNLG